MDDFMGRVLRFMLFIMVFPPMLGMFIFGIYMTVQGVGDVYSTHQETKEFVSVKGTFAGYRSDVDEEYIISDEDVNPMAFTYKVDGKEYIAYLHDDGMQITSEKRIIKYNPKNPSDAYCPSLNLDLSMLIIGFLMIILSFPVLLFIMKMYNWVPNATVIIIPHIPFIGLIILFFSMALLSLYTCYGTLSIDFISNNIVDKKPIIVFTVLGGIGVFLLIAYLFEIIVNKGIITTISDRD